MSQKSKERQLSVRKDHQSFSSAKNRKSPSSAKESPTFPPAEKVSTIPERLRTNIRDPELLQSYSHLWLQPIDAHSIIEAMKDNDLQLLSEFLKTLISNNNPKYNLWLKCHNEEDILTIKSIFEQQLMDSCRFAYNYGFTPYKLSLWITIYLEVAHSTIVNLNIRNEFNEKHWSELCREIVYKNLNVEQQSLTRVKFTDIEIQKMFEFITKDFGQHLQLYRHFSLYSKQKSIRKIRKRIEILNNSLNPLREGFPADKWEEIRTKEKERLQREENELKEEIERKVLEEKAKIEFEMMEAQTAKVKSRLAEAEKAMTKPITPYPIAPPSPPTLESIFRKEIRINTQPRMDNSKPSIDKPKAIKVNVTKLELKAPKGSLVEPPDLSKSEPIDLRKIKEAMRIEKMNEEIQEVQKEEPIIEYQYIPLEQAMSRNEVSEFLNNRILKYNEEMRKWIQGLLEFEKQQWLLRITEVQKAKEARDEDKQRRSKLDSVTSSQLKPKSANGPSKTPIGKTKKK